MEVSIELGDLALEALSGEAGAEDPRLGERLAGALNLYLHDRERSPAGWAFPKFMRERDAASRRKVTVEIEDDLWQEVGAEAERQEVSPERLAEHAVLYFAAELNAGRIAGRLRDDLGEEVSGRS